MTDYEKFKKLLALFVSHIEAIQAGEKSIPPLNKKCNALKTDFSETQYGNILVNISNQFTYGFTTKTCYLEWERGTGVNVNCIWNNEKSKIEKLQLQQCINGGQSQGQFEDPEMKVDVSKLDLFSTDFPNSTLITFFNNYCRMYNPQMFYMKEIINLLTANKNLILTGAPGTGKTYLAKEIAKAMEENGQLQFVQFHPSYDYTDFVEGLRPTPPDENVNIGFERKDGVFKEFCKMALKNLIDSSKSQETLSEERRVDELLKKFLEFIGGKIEEEGNIPFDNSKEYIIAIEENGIRYSQSTTERILNFEDIKSAFIDKTFDKKDIEDNEHLSKKARNIGISGYTSKIVKLFKDFSEKESKDIDISANNHIQRHNYIFIIDEINRGEISKIFGELFFSIDPSYRGEKGRVQTQYANLIDDGDVFKDGFFVPENVYIIGTMNDIDRSVESFDFAMRRRFTWKEITAKDSQKMFDKEDGSPETWKDEAIKRMDAINDVIWKDKDNHIEGLNSSFHIGGAYFKNNLPKHNNDFGKVWEYHIKPLLKEYLRGMPDTESKLEKLENAYYGQ